MPDLLRQAAEWLCRERNRHLSHRVLYCRGDLVSEVLATVGQTETTTDDGYGAVVQRVSRDYLIAVSDLVLGGMAVEPTRGDLIVDGGHHYDVLAPPGRPCFETDRYRTTYRIHTKHVAETNP